MKRPCTLLLEEIEFEGHSTTRSRQTWVCELDQEDIQETDHFILPLEGLTPEWLAENEGNMISGETSFWAPQLVIRQGKIWIPKHASPVLTPKEPRIVDPQNREVLAVRVIARDASTTSTMEEISDSIFGTDGDDWNLQTQYASCSYGKANFIPAPNQASPGPVEDGVVEVTISKAVTGAHRYYVMYLVKIALLRAGFSLPGYAHVMFCLPPGTRTEGDWRAFAYVGHWLSVYNDDICTYLSYQMHEIGHNLNLAHSSEGGSEYGDHRYVAKRTTNPEMVCTALGLHFKPTYHFSLSHGPFLIPVYDSHVKKSKWLHGYIVSTG